MSILAEFGPPFQWKPGYFQSRIVYRVWWGWFAISILRVPLIELLDPRRFEWLESR